MRRNFRATATLSVWLIVGSICHFSLSLGLRQADADAPDKEAAGDVDIGELRGIDLDGRLRRIADRTDCRAVVVVFLAVSCPISNSTIPALNSLAAEYRPKGIEFYGVISSRHVTQREARKHRGDYRLEFPILLDSGFVLKDQLGATHTPQAIVFDRRGQRMYSGRIDNRYSNLGQKRLKATSHDLHGALQDVLANRKVSVSTTVPVGCLLEDRPVANEDQSVTFNRDIAPLLSAHCSECHRPNQTAPFSLLTFEDAVEHARQIGEVTAKGFMPPWHPTDEYGHFQNSRRLTQREVQLIQKWVKIGMPEGRAQDQIAPAEFSNTWRLGQPDLVLKMSQAFRIDASGADVHQHFVIPTGLVEDRLVSAIEFRPGNPRIVHHASFYVDVSGKARAMSDRYGDIGYGNFPGPGFLTVGALRSWLPGMSPQRLPEGTGQPLFAGSDLVMEIHYQKSGKPESDQSEVGIYFAEPDANELVYEIQVMNQTLEIPADATNHLHHASYTLPVAATLIDAAPHMHLLGRSMKASATLPNGEVIPLIWIKDWDFNWQSQYLFSDPISLPQGTRIDVEAWYDNSAGNPLNPFAPPRTVRWGDQTSDEMGICHFRYTCQTTKKMNKMNAHYVRYATGQQRQREKMQGGAKGH